MMSSLVTRRSGRVALLAASSLLLLSACGSDSSSSTAGDGEEQVGVTLITKTANNPFFLTMQEGAEAEAEKQGVNLTSAAGREDGDEPTQVTAIENAISRGDQGILIAPNGPSVETAMKKARDAGIYVIALDTPPTDPTAADITFATDNRVAGELIGQWAAGTLAGEKAVIGLLDLFPDKINVVDNARDQGFLAGFGIDVVDPDLIGDEAATGTYTGGQGGEYEIAGHEPSLAAEDGGRTAMETLLSKNPNINVVYTINEPAAYGAYQALQAAGKEDEVTMVSVDGGCTGVGYVKDGFIGATSQQYPLKMAELGVDAIVKLVKDGETPETSEGLDFFDTGVALVTDAPVDGVDSIDTAEGETICWG